MDYDISKPGWFRQARDFQDLIGHVSNFPLSYAYALMLALSGHVIGRNANIRYAQKIYPNHYICLVGSSGIHHKSTAIGLSLEAMGNERLADYPPIRSLTTTQGLLTAMSNTGGQGLVVLDELASMTAKRKQDYASDLLSRIVELYGCPPVSGTYTRHDPIEVFEPYLTMISASTVEWLQSTLQNADLLAGFGNRMTFILGTPREEKDWPTLPHFEHPFFDPIIDFEGNIQLDQYARIRWGEFYKRFQARQVKNSAFVQVLAERVPEKVLKNVIVQAAWNKTTLVDHEMLERAIDWGTYLYRCVEQLTPAFEAVESQVLQAVQDGANTPRKLYSRFSATIDTKRVQSALKALEWIGLIEKSADPVSHSLAYIPIDKSAPVEHTE